MVTRVIIYGDKDSQFYSISPTGQGDLSSLMMEVAML
jgi:hypothetical protein